VSGAQTARQEVLGTRESNGSHGSSGGGAASPPSVPHPTASVPQPSSSGSLGLLWVAAALAALAALAGATLVRRGFGRPLATRGAPAGGAPNMVEAAAAAAALVAASAEDEEPVEDESVAPPPGGDAEVVARALAALSAGNVDAAARMVHPDVMWPTVSGETMRGREAFRAYWTRRLDTVAVSFTPLRFDSIDGQVLVEVHEVTHSRIREETIGEYRALRRFRFRDGLIAEMTRGYA